MIICLLKIKVILKDFHSFIHSQTLIVKDGPLASLFGVS
jgi:hypothetical protein